jgi:tetratricopeptide (TPR) repeat protein
MQHNQTTPTRKAFRFAALALVGCAIALMAGGCSGRRSEQYRKQGDTYLRLEKYEEAHEAYQRSLSLNPDNALAKVGQGRLAAVQGNSEAALELLQDAIALEPGNVTAHFETVNVLLAMGDVKNALNLANKLKEKNPEEGECLIATIKGRIGALASQTGKETSDLPTKTADAAPPRSDTQPAPTDQDGQTWQGLWQRAELRQLVARRAEFLTTGDELVGQTLLLASVLANDRGAAADLAERLPATSRIRAFYDLIRDPDVAAVQAFANEWPEEERDDREILRLNAVGFALSQTGARANAVRVFSRALERWPDHVVSAFNIAQVYRAADMPRFAARTLELLLTKAPDNDEMRSLIFHTLRGAGLSDEARTAAETSFSVRPESEAFALNLVQAYLDAGDLVAAQSILSYAFTVHPDSPPLHLASATVSLSSGDPAAALATLDSLPSGPRQEWQAWAVSLFARAALGEWETVQIESLNVPPEARTPALRLLLASAEIRANANGAAREHVAPLAESQGPAQRTAHILVSSLSGEAQDNDFTLALAANRAALADYAYAEACRLSSFHAAAAALYEKLEKALNGVSPTPQLAIQALALATTLPDRQTRGEAIAAKHPDSPQVCIAMANLYRSLEDTPREKEMMDKLAAIAPGVPTTWLAIAQFHQRQDDMTAAAAAYRKLIALTPDDPAAHNNLAYSLLVTHEDPEQALASARVAAQKLPNSPIVLHTLGVAELRQKLYDDSRKHLALALELRPGDPTLLLDYGQLLIETGKTELGRSHVNQALLYAAQLGVDFPRAGEARSLLDTTAEPKEADQAE